MFSSVAAPAELVALGAVLPEPRGKRGTTLHNFRDYRISGCNSLRLAETVGFATKESLRWTSARRTARVAGALYLSIIMASLYGLYRPKTRLAFYSGIAAFAVFFIVVLLLYFLLRPVSRRLSFVAALFGVAAAAMGLINRFHLAPFRMSNLVLMAFWCILVGILIVRSSFMPRFLGVLMVIAAPGYLTLLWPQFGNALKPDSRRHWGTDAGGVAPR